MTCTFKNDKAPTGLASVGWRQGCVIKYKKMVCGRIDPPNYWTGEENCRVRLMVIDGESWKWITLKARFNTLEEAKVFVKDNFDSLMAQFKLRFSKD